MKKLVNKISKVERFGTCCSDYMYFVHYENGDIEQYASANMPKEIYKWMSGADFEFCRSETKGYFHKWTK